MNIILFLLIGLAAGWIAALYPPALLIGGQTYTQELAALCLLVVGDSVLALAREPRASRGVPAGIALGAGIITRPSMMSVLAILGLAAVLWAITEQHLNEDADGLD